MKTRTFAQAFAALVIVSAAACSRPPTAPEALDGHWDVQQVAGASLGEGVSINLRIDTNAGEMRGFDGCTEFTAPVSTFGETMSIGAVAAQEGACATPAAETDKTRFLAVLSSVARYSRHGRSLELLPREQGEALVLLRNTDAADAAN